MSLITSRLFTLVESQHASLSVVSANNRADSRGQLSGPKALIAMQIATTGGKPLFAETFSASSAECLTLEQMTTIFGPESSDLSEVEMLRLKITADIERLRCLSDDPVDIQFDAHTSFEIHPLGEGSRITIYRKGWGGTSVNYLDDCLSLNVFAEDNLNSLHHLLLPQDDLET